MLYDKYEDLIGKRLLHHLTDAHGLLLVPEGTLLSESQVEKMRKFKIDLADIHAEPVSPESGKQEAETEPEPEPQAAPADAKELVRKTGARLQDVEHFVQANGTVPVAELEDKVLPVIMEAARKRNLFQLFADLKSMGDYRYKQTIGVVVMSAMLGKWLRLEEQELSLLTTAASLYDIGSVKLPSYLLSKPDRYQPSEFEIMKEHTVMGHRLLLESGVDPRVASVALQHHEREDGSGYPRGLKGGEIDRLAKIVALADAYVAMTSDRPYRAAIPFYQVVREIHGGIIRGRFDSAIGLTFLNGLMAAQIGSDVILSDGRGGKILLVNPNYPTEPLIAVEEEFIDLSKTDSLRIQEIVG
ncbi:HD domain-containing protein [Cohnella sp. CFH 77786]|uniref:HD-GYP domain-containing protein n=1 Tax=Cohnella sp. CFH 77786 TaxID=2662265 RepID=UPI001C610187|nr:HD domain-containing phosphohydrolase [Cohnella sp. CFH 77786]MBW5445589.1 HD domain-containing protein [Cohnella sp. CFH 77786]